MVIGNSSVGIERDVGIGFGGKTEARGVLDSWQY